VQEQGQVREQEQEQGLERLLENTDRLELAQGQEPQQGLRPQEQLEGCLPHPLDNLY